MYRIYFRYLTVFRDLLEGRPTAPTEWNGEKDRDKPEVNIFIISNQIINIQFSKGHEDDIVCMAVTSFSPQLLASGSTDGEICIWNTSSELFVRRLNQRKRNPNNTQAKVSKRFSCFCCFMLFLLHY